VLWRCFADIHRRMYCSERKAAGRIDTVFHHAVNLLYFNYSAIVQFAIDGKHSGKMMIYGICCHARGSNETLLKPRIHRFPSCVRVPFITLEKHSIRAPTLSRRVLIGRCWKQHGTIPHCYLLAFVALLPIGKPVVGNVRLAIAEISGNFTHERRLNRAHQKDARWQVRCVTFLSVLYHLIALSSKSCRHRSTGQSDDKS